MEEKKIIGKIGFGVRKNEKNQDEDKAIANALQCFEDGIFKVLINEKEVFYGNKIEIKDGDKIVFIRLTMLSGRMW